VAVGAEDSRLLFIVLKGKRYPQTTDVLHHSHRVIYGTIIMLRFPEKESSILLRRHPLRKEEEEEEEDKVEGRRRRLCFACASAGILGEEVPSVQNRTKDQVTV
jgi:hypothetical protein